MPTSDIVLPAPAPESHAWLVVQYIMTRPWIPLVLGFMVVLGVGIMTTRTVTASEEYNKEVREALVTIGAAESVMLSVLEVNSAQRGYIISPSRAFRERSRESQRNLTRDLAMLNMRFEEIGVTPDLAMRVKESTDDRILGFRETDRLLAEGNIALAGQYSTSARQFTDNVRSALEEVKKSALNRVVERQHAAAKAGDRAFLLTIAGLIVACLLILGSIVLLMRRSIELEAANNEVRGMAQTLEERVKQRTADLEEANEEIQRFAYIVSHDLRSPLVNIMGFTSELEDTQQTVADFVNDPATTAPDLVREAVLTDMPEAMGFIRASTGRMDRLIKAILQISREGRRSLNDETIVLSEMFEGLSDSLTGQTDEADAQIDIGPMPDVVGDRVALEQVFGNLLDNAIKYLKPGVPGQISVTSETRGKRVLIRVNDNGRGIAAHDRRRVFELFRRSGEQDKPGEGIGLAHVQALVRRLGGQISVESELGEGSCFTVNLPLTMSTRQ